MKILVSFEPETDDERAALNPDGLVLELSTADYEFSTPRDVVGEGAHRKTGTGCGFSLTAHCEGTENWPTWRVR